MSGYVVRYPKLPVRSELLGTEIDFAGDEIRHKTIAGNTTFTIINPILGRVIMLEIDGVFTVTLPGTVEIINGDYCPNLGVNYLWLFCNNESAPTYLGSWTTEV
jgi:hypothetical protein